MYTLTIRFCEHAQERYENTTCKRNTVLNSVVSDYTVKVIKLWSTRSFISVAGDQKKCTQVQLIL